MSAQATGNQDPQHPSPQEFPAHILKEMERAKALFKSRYNLDPNLHTAADPLFPYPIHFWHLMEYHLCVQMKEIEQRIQQQQATEIKTEREDALASLEEKATPKPAPDEKEHLSECLSTLAAYTGKEERLEKGLFLPIIEGFEFIDLSAHIISLARKFGYQTPLTEQDLTSPILLKVVDKDHPAFAKYAAELGGEGLLDLVTVLEWEYEGANTFLQQFTPPGCYCGFETDYGWGVFEEGAFEAREPY